MNKFYKKVIAITFYLIDLRHDADSQSPELSSKVFLTKSFKEDNEYEKQ